MAQAEVNSIAETMRAAAQRQLDAKRLQHEAEHQAAQLKLEQDKFKEEINQHSIANKSAKALLDAQLALHQTQQAQIGQQMGEATQKGAPPVSPLMPQASSLSSGEPNYTPANPSANPQTSSTSLMAIPGTSLNVPVLSPEATATRQANIDETLAAPKRATEAAKQQAETDRILKTQSALQAAETDRFIKQINTTQAAETEREKLRIAGENHRNAVTAATSRANALLPYSWLQNMPPEQRSTIFKPYNEGMLSGDISGKQVHSDFAEKGMAGAGAGVISQFISAGGVVPTDKQVDFKKKIAPIIDAVPLIKQYIDLLPNTTNTTMGAIKATGFGLTHPLQFNQQLKSIEQQIEFNIAPVARTLGGDEGQRLQKALLGPAEGGYMPSKSATKEANVANYNRFIDLINKVLDSQYAGMPAAQRAIVKSSLGLDKLSKLTPDGKPVKEVTQPIQNQPSATHIWTPQGVKPVGQN